MAYPSLWIGGFFGIGFQLEKIIIDSLQRYQLAIQLLVSFVSLIGLGLAEMEILRIGSIGIDDHLNLFEFFVLNSRCGTSCMNWPCISASMV